MQENVPSSKDIKNLAIESLGKAAIPSPLGFNKEFYVSDEQRVLVNAEVQSVNECLNNNQTPLSFEIAGPRQKIFFHPQDITCGIVTCGGICPGLNDVIRTITLTLKWQYGVKKVLGFRFGYEGLSSHAKKEPLELTDEIVDGIQHGGGTILGSSRGPHEPADMVNTLLKYQVGILFVIGGDGTFRGAHEISEEAQKRGIALSVIAIPKTIDNDIYCSETTFGFATAVEEARSAIAAAHEEARSAWNGVGLVKLMGRDSGFIAVGASLGTSDVNFCLIPEVPFALEGGDGLLALLEKRLIQKRHAVIVVAEGAGQDLIHNETARKDASGNILHDDIGLFLKNTIKNHFKNKNLPITVKFIDPSYTIRSCPANAQDSIYCLQFGQNAVHAGMAGKTDMFIGFWNHHFTHVPLNEAIGRRKKINPDGGPWQMIRFMMG